jgi:ABC-2 type transport system ATP-binding protein
LEEAEHLCRNIAIINGGEIVENTSMKELHTRLDKEVFILDADALPALIPPLDGYDITRVDAHTLEVVIHKKQTLNTVFEHLSSHQITISSMRNKANRLEELFVNLVNKGAK